MNNVDDVEFLLLAREAHTEKSYAESFPPLEIIGRIWASLQLSQMPSSSGSAANSKWLSMHKLTR